MHVEQEKLSLTYHKNIIYKFPKKVFIVFVNDLYGFPVQTYIFYKMFDFIEYVPEGNKKYFNMKEPFEWNLNISLTSDFG